MLVHVFAHKNKTSVQTLATPEYPSISILVYHHIDRDAFSNRTITLPWYKHVLWFCGDRILGSVNSFILLLLPLIVSCHFCYFIRFILLQAFGFWSCVFRFFDYCLSFFIFLYFKMVVYCGIRICKNSDKTTKAHLLPKAAPTRSISCSIYGTIITLIDIVQ